MLTISDAELALIKENFFKQMEAKGYDAPTRGVLFFDVYDVIDKIFFGYKLFNVRFSFSFDPEGTTQCFEIELGDFYAEETQFYPNDTQEALINRLTTYQYNVFPTVEEGFKIQQVYLESQEGKLVFDILKENAQMQKNIQ